MPEPLLAALEVADFKYEAAEYPALVGKLFQVIFLHERPECLPFIAQRSGTGIRAGAIYARREGQTEEATYEEVQRLIDERLAVTPQTIEARNLKEHLEELKLLYAEIPKNLGSTGTLFMPISQELQGRFAALFGEARPNPRYPEEDYQAFVRRLLDGKKRLIEELTGVERKA